MMSGQVLTKLDPALVPVLRAGLGLVPSFLKLLPTAKVGHIGMYRDHTTLKPVPYYRNFPPMLEDRAVYVLDPMLATGGSASEAIQEVKDAGAMNITLVTVIAAPEGLARLEKDHPDLRIVVGAVDRGLDEKGYILPGLGDSGDRTFGTICVTTWPALFCQDVTPYGPQADAMDDAPGKIEVRHGPSDLLLGFHHDMTCRQKVGLGSGTSGSSSAAVMSTSCGTGSSGFNSIAFR